AIRILIGAVLGSPAAPVDRAGLRTRSWPGVLDIIRPVYLDLHYQTDADGLVIVADSDSSPVHQPEHDEPGKRDHNCRLCKIRDIIEEAKRRSRPVPQRRAFHCSAGLTVPEISAWYQWGRDPHVNEASWINGLRLKKLPYTKQQLKLAAFGKSYLPQDEA